MFLQLPFLLLATLVELTIAATPTRTLSVHQWPLGAPSPTPLLNVVYSPTTLNATVESYRPPRLSKNHQLVRVGHLSEPRNFESWTGVLTKAEAFEEGYTQQVELLLGEHGDDVIHVGFRAGRIPSELWKRKTNGKGAQSIEVKVTRPKKGPVPELDRPIVVNAEGKVPETEPEKTMLQRYWWVFLGAAVIALVGSGEK
ncbi:MAG: hypothetical protein M1833_000829 [Piccolia ochrophora]|nr:MAG: hypothetical protein M1833_000829 [Piccolia ochrophora]